MFSSLSSPRSRYPLYTRLVAVVGGIVVAAGLSLWGNVEAEQHLERTFAELAELCAPPPPRHAGAVCAALAEAEHSLLERAAVTLLLQGFCLALILAGAALLASQGYWSLVRRTDAALGLGSDIPTSLGGDEIDRLAGNLAALSARQAAFESEGRWLRRTTADQIKRKSQALQALQEVAHLFCSGDVSRFSVLRALTRIESALGARTVALCLSEAARHALGTEAVLTTRSEPALLRMLALPPGSRETTARIVPAPTVGDGPGLVVPASRGDACVATLVAEFSPATRVDDPQRELAESFAHILALAISSVSRSREERRLALMEERTAIAAELHDSLAQSLGFMKIQVARLQRRLERGEPPAEAVPMARALREGLSAAYGEVRELISAFRARMEPGGLLATVQETVDAFAQRGSLDVAFSHDVERCHLEVNEEFHVVQVVREALSNALRHACARHVWIHAQYGPAHLFSITVDDDGCGLDAARAAEDNHYGLSIMRERARSLGGELAVVRRPEGGTQVRLSFAPQRLPAPVLEDLAE